MANRFVKVGGSNLFSGATLEEAWEDYIFGVTNMGASNSLTFSGLSGGVFVVDRSSLQTPIPSGVEGAPTIITDNGDGQVTFKHPGVGNAGLLYFNNASPAKHHISFIGTSPGSIKFDLEYQSAAIGMIYCSVGGNHHILFKRIEITRSPASGAFTGHEADITFDECLIHSNGTHSEGSVPQDHGIYGVGPNLTIKNSKIYDNWGWGLHIYSSNPSNYTGLQILSNWIYNNGYGTGSQFADGIVIEEGTDGLIANNLIFKNSGSGISLWRCSGTKVLHNALHENGRYGLQISTAGTTTDISAKNNIVIGNSLGSIRVEAAALNTIIDFNICDAAVSNAAGGETTTTNHVSDAVAINEWELPSGPFASRNYKLKSGAKSIGAVTTNECPLLGEVTVDIDGMARTGSYADQGPYRFVVGGGETQADFLSLTSIDTDGSATDTLVTSAFATSGIDRHVDVFIGIASGSSVDVVSVSRDSETYVRQRADSNPTESFWQQSEFWMSISEPGLGPAPMTVINSASRSDWGFSAVAINGCDQVNRLRGGTVILNPDGDGSVDNLVVSSAAGDLVVSGIMGNSGTMPTSNVGDGTLRGSWQTGSPAGWGLTATAPGASSVTLGWNNVPYRFVHYAAIHPPSASTTPGPPTSLLVTNYSPTAQILSFSAPIDDGGAPITGYQIERESPVGGGWSTIVADTGSTATSYPINGLSPATQYNYRVSAINSAGIGGPSSAASGTTPQVGNNAQLAFQAWNNYYIPSLPIASAMNQAGQQQIQHQPRSPLYILDTFPILVVPGTQYTQRGFTTAMGGVSVIDTNGDLDTIRVEATSGQAWVTLHGCTVTVGSLGTNDFTIQGTQANLLAAIASLSYTGTVKGEQAIILTATDALGHQDTKFFTVMVLNNAPVITSNGGGASTAINVEEGQTAVTTVVATDLDPSDDLVYGIVGGADAAKFSIDDETGVLTFVEAPDHDVPTDADMNNVYEVIVQATDGEAVDIQTLSVTVTIVPIPVSRSFALPVEWRYDMQGPLVVASMEWTTIVPALFIEVPMELALALGKVALVPTEARGIHVLERSASHEWIMNLGVERVVPAAWLTAAFSQRTAFADYWGPVTVARVVSMESRGQIASIDQARTVGHEWVLAVSRESGVIPHWHGISVIFQSSPVLESGSGMIRLHVLPMEWVVSVENAKSASSESLQSPIASLVLPHEALGLVRAPREVMDEARQWLASPHAVTGEWTIAHQAGKVLPFESLRATKVGGLVPYEDWGMHGRFFVIPFEILKQI